MERKTSHAKMEYIFVFYCCSFDFRITCITGAAATQWQGPVTILRLDKDSHGHQTIPTYNHDDHISKYSYLVNIMLIMILDAFTCDWGCPNEVVVHSQ